MLCCIYPVGLGIAADGGWTARVRCFVQGKGKGMVESVYSRNGMPWKGEIS